MEDWKSRLHTEHADLSVKLTKLQSQLGDAEKMAKLNQRDKGLLEEQEQHMRNYLRVLALRLGL